MSTPQTHIKLNSATYKLARKSLVPQGSREWNARMRPSERGDPGDLLHADWHTWGSNLHSFEEPEGPDGEGYLGVDYSLGIDTRWPGRAVLGPAITTITLSTHDQSYTASIMDESTAVSDSNWYLDAPPSSGNVTDIEVFKGGGSTYAYLARGQFVSKVDLSDMALEVGTQTFPDRVWTLQKTLAANTAAEMSAGMAEAAYQVMDVCATPPSLDSWRENTDGEIAKIIRVAADRVAGLHRQTIKGNVLTGSVTMYNPNWNTVATISVQNLVPTGFALDGNIWVPVYDDGPYILDADEDQFFPLIPEIDKDSANRAVGTWFPLGVLFNHRYGARWYRAGNGTSWGPEAYSGNRSPVHGQVMSFAGTERWLYMAVLSPKDTKPYLVAFRPEGDPRSPIGYAPYVLGRISETDNIRVDAMRYVGTVDGLRTNPTLIGGLSGNAWHMTLGRDVQETEDSNYRFATSGTSFLTVLRRYPHMIKDLESWEITGSNCTANRTITLSIGSGAVNSGTTTAGTVAGLNDTIKSNGGARRLFVDDSGVPLSVATGTTQPRPILQLSSNVNTDSPVAEGLLRIYYRVRPVQTREIVAYLELDDSNPAATTEDQSTALQNLVDQSGPVTCTDAWGDAIYVKVTQVETQEVLDQGVGPERQPRPVQLAKVTMVTWATVSGS